MKREITPERNDLPDRKSYWVTLFGRLKTGVTQAQAEAAINAPYRAQLEQDVQLLRQPRKDFLQRFRAKKIILKPGQYGRGGVREEGRRPLFLLMGMAVLVLLIACANVANLQLARSATRMREVAIRLAMGASRMQLIRQLLTESCLLAVAGGALGLVAAQWTLRGILAAIPPSRGMQGMLSEALDTRVLLFCLALSMLTGILFGLFPALQGSKANLVASLKDQAGQISSTGTANAFRKVLVTAQVAISLVLLISAGLFGKTLVNLASVELGVQTDHLMTFSVLPKLNQYSDQRIAQFHAQLIERLAAIPGVKLVSAAQVPAIAGSSSSTNITVEGYVPPTDTGAQSNYNVVGAGYFRTLGMPLVAGREFARGDNTTSPKVAVVNEAFVRQFLPGRNPLGSRLGRPKPDIEIVGVVKDAKYSDMRQAPPAVFYTPLEQSTRWFSVYYYLRTAIEPERTTALIRREVAALDPGLPIRDLKTMQAQIEENTFAERLLSVLTGSFAGLATVLAAVGLYGVLAYNVARRTREIDIRMALGADAGHVRGLVVREVALMLVVGTVAGIASASAAGKFLQSFLYGMKPWDMSVYGSAAVVLWLVALGAAYVPARRATGVDPMIALRYE
jgi:predicted permease